MIRIIFILSLVTLLFACGGSPKKEVQKPKANKVLNTIERLEKDFKVAKSRELKSASWHDGYTTPLELHLVGPIFSHPSDLQHAAFKALDQIMAQLPTRRGALDVRLGEGFSNRYSNIFHSRFRLGEAQFNYIESVFAFAYRDEANINAIFDSDSQKNQGMELGLAIDTNQLKAGNLVLKGYKTVLEPNRDRNSAYFEFNAGPLPSNAEQIFNKLSDAVMAVLAVSIPEYASIERAKALQFVNNVYVTEKGKKQTTGHTYRDRIAKLNQEKAQRLAQLERSQLLKDSRYGMSLNNSVFDDFIAYVTKQNHTQHVKIASNRQITNTQIVIEKRSWEEKILGVGFLKDDTLLIFSDKFIRRYSSKTKGLSYEVAVNNLTHFAVDDSGTTAYFTMNNALYRLNTASGKFVNVAALGDVATARMAISATGKILLVGDQNGLVRAFATSNNQWTGQQYQFSQIRDMAIFSEKKSEVLLVDNKNTINLWNIEQSQINNYESPAEKIVKIAANETKEKFAVRTESGAGYIYDIDARSALRQISGYSLSDAEKIQGTSVLQFAKNGEFLFIGGNRPIRKVVSFTRKEIEDNYSNLLNKSEKRTWLDADKSYQHVYVEGLKETDLYYLSKTGFIDFDYTQAYLTFDQMNEALNVIGMSTADPMLISALPKVFASSSANASVMNGPFGIRVVNYNRSLFPKSMYAVSTPDFASWGIDYETTSIGKHGFEPNAYDVKKVNSTQPAFGRVSIQENEANALVYGKTRSEFIDLVGYREPIITKSNSTPVNNAMLLNDVGEYLVSTQSGSIQLRSFDENAFVSTFSGYVGDVSTIKRLDDTNILTASQDGLIKVWDTIDKKPNSLAFIGHTGKVNDIALNPSKTTLYSTSADGTIRIWDITSRKQIGQFNDAQQQSLLAYAEGPNYVIYQNNQQKIIARDVETKEQIWSVNFTKPIDRLMTSRSGQILYVLSEGKVDVFNLKNAQLLKQIKQVDTPILDFVLSNDDESMFILKDDVFEIWNTGWFNFVSEL